MTPTDGPHEVVSPPVLPPPTLFGLGTCESGMAIPPQATAEGRRDEPDSPSFPFYGGEGLSEQLMMGNEGYEESTRDGHRASIHTVAVELHEVRELVHTVSKRQHELHYMVDNSLDGLHYAIRLLTESLRSSNPPSGDFEKPDAPARARPSTATPAELGAQLATHGFRDLELASPVSMRTFTLARPASLRFGSRKVQWEVNAESNVMTPASSPSGTPRAKAERQVRTRKLQTPAEPAHSADDFDRYGNIKARRARVQRTVVSSEMNSENQLLLNSMSDGTPVPVSKAGSISSLNEYRKERDLTLVRKSSAAFKNDVNISILPQAGSADMSDTDVSPDDPTQQEPTKTKWDSWFATPQKRERSRWAQRGSCLVEVALGLLGVRQLPFRCCPGFIKAAYPLIPVLLNLAFLAMSILVTVADSTTFSDQQQQQANLWERLVNVPPLASDISVAFTSVVALALIGPFGPGASDLLASKESLDNIAELNGFSLQWDKKTTVQALTAFVVWVATLASRAWDRWHAGCRLGEVDTILQLCLFAMSTGTLIASSLVILHYAYGLQKLVEKFIVSYVQNPDTGSTVHTWSLVTALLRTTSYGLQWLFVTLGGMSGITILIAIIDMKRGQMESILPIFILVFCLMVVFLHAAAVTESCTRVPTIVNELDLGEDFIERLALVQHLQASKAGVCIFGTLVTLSKIQTFTYLMVVSAFTISTKVLNLA